MPTANSPAAVFDRIADDYDRHRPTYPDALIDRATAGLTAGARVLEIGCGTGQLTRSLLARGLEVTAVEPGPNLVERARRNVGGRARFVNARFEDARLPTAPFDAVFCASAWHWLDPDHSWRKAAAVLVPGGTLALLQHCASGGTDMDDEALTAAMATAAPDLMARWPKGRDEATIEAGVRERADNVSDAWSWVGGYDVARSHAAALYDRVQLACTPIPLRHTADELVAVLRTTSLYQRLPPEQAAALDREIAGLQERLGRPLRSCAVAAVLTARRSRANV